MDKNQKKMAEYALLVESALEKSIPSHGEACVCEAMKYGVLGGGKRIRAALVLEFARIYDAMPQDALPFACAVEMIHAYSLIHDDLPCMDDDDLRRGKPSCHKQFGETTALLAGDALLTLAFETVATAPISGDRCIEAVALLAKAGGIAGMIGGQMLDLQAEQHAISLQELKKLYQWKTGALLSVSAQLGCIVGIASKQERAYVDEYMQDIGLLFQIIDDILDVTGDASVLGKPIGSDVEQKKNTYVSILGLDGARQAAKVLAEQAREKAKKIADPNFLLWLVELLLTRDH